MLIFFKYLAATKSKQRALHSLSFGTGVHTVANIGDEECFFKVCCCGALVGPFVAVILAGSTAEIFRICRVLFVTSLTTTAAANFFGRRWRSPPAAETGGQSSAALCQPGGRRWWSRSLHAIVVFLFGLAWMVGAATAINALVGLQSRSSDDAPTAFRIYKIYKSIIIISQNIALLI